MPSPRDRSTSTIRRCRPTARVFKGCRLEEDFFNPFIKDGKITLVLDRNHADFQVAQDVADLINGQALFPVAIRPIDGPGHQPRECRRADSAAVSRPARVVRLAGAQPADARAADRSPRGHQSRDGHDRHRRRRRDRRGGVTHKNMDVDIGGERPDRRAPPASRFVPLETSATPTPEAQSAGRYAQHAARCRQRT